MEPLENLKLICSKSILELKSDSHKQARFVLEGSKTSIRLLEVTENIAPTLHPFFYLILQHDFTAAFSKKW